MEAGSTPAPGNSLGLDIEIQNLSIGDDGTIPAPEPSEQPAHALKNGMTDATKKVEKKPYVNADRYMTGSNPRVKVDLIHLPEQIYNRFGRRNQVTMSLLLVWLESERTTRGSSNVDWYVAYVLILVPTDVVRPVGCKS